MRVMLDACVLYPTVMRETVLRAASATGAITPMWSARLLEEWARAARKLGPTGEDQARAEIALVRAGWPDAEVAPPEALERRLWLPDPADIHVLAAAVAGSADSIITLNAKDFPRNILSDEGLSRQDPDALLMMLWPDHTQALKAVACDVLAEARRLSGDDWEMRALFKKARLPRFAKALTR